ncbi:MAG TPA: BlaI/MecI/CopY family transcriptional regulator [Phycisphaerae bacterium]|jgi:BlaI family penicillinase repressor|nr:BlaI/MecI/CopY family transcriptional regulator [Phycisphaerae bacterium]HOB74625.1 BlaI/MecI/CopY family transcriptional regulator [Phycisphaerae bacterium]HOJ53580.1 BlaI/MecI/CopY family transcriptional regulator [Phycisphaerae bacterium]HOL25263.1 BlaI/MecI/CopY family transcriptional regulator [Phycisphaerae bacterium]HPP20522.1 BlaI/MecI/CopY family transcriptional regulator [Phycisphaerae bacterium]
MARLTPGELEVMQVLWKESPLKPAEIEARLPRPIGNAALRSVLRVLLNKGHVKRAKQGKAYFYRPTQPAHSSFRQMAQKLADVFFGGSSLDLIAGLIKSEKLSDEDIRKLQDIVRTRNDPAEAHPPGEKS